MLNINKTAGRTNPAVKLMRKLIIAIAILGVLFGVGSLVFTWFEENFSGTPESIKIIQVASKDSSSNTPSPTAKVNATLQYIANPVTQGGDESMSVRTNLGTKCTVKVVYDKDGSKVASVDPKLTEKTADAFGLVGWSWTVPTTVPAGKSQATATCSNPNSSVTVNGDFVVNKQ